jgi:hypothetical protein
VARDCDGVFLEGGCSKLSYIASPLQGEAYAALFALRRVANLGMSRIILETDVTELKMTLTTTTMDLNVDENLFKQIKECMSFYFDQCLIQHCPMSCNKVAYCLAKYGMSMISSGSSLFMRSSRLCIQLGLR